MKISAMNIMQNIIACIFNGMKCTYFNYQYFVCTQNKKLFVHIDAIFNCNFFPIIQKIIENLDMFTSDLFLLVVTVSECNLTNFDCWMQWIHFLYFRRDAFLPNFSRQKILMVEYYHNVVKAVNNSYHSYIVTSTFYHCCLSIRKK